MHTKYKYRYTHTQARTHTHIHKQQWDNLSCTVTSKNLYPNCTSNDASVCVPNRLFSNTKHYKMHIRFCWLYCKWYFVAKYWEILHRMCAVASSTTRVICFSMLLLCHFSPRFIGHFINTNNCFFFSSCFFLTFWLSCFTWKFVSEFVFGGNF